MGGWSRTKYGSGDDNLERQHEQQTRGVLRVGLLWGLNRGHLGRRANRSILEMQHSQYKESRTTGVGRVYRRTKVLLHVHYYQGGFHFDGRSLDFAKRKRIGLLAKSNEHLQRLRRASAKDNGVLSLKLILSVIIIHCPGSSKTN